MRHVTKILRGLLVPALVLAGLGLAHAGAPVWKISGNNTHLYLGGTLHVLAPGDYPLPHQFDQAFARADLLVLETDLDATQSESFAKKMMGQMVYADGRTLTDRISPDTLGALDRFARDRGLSMANLDRFKPGLVMVFLTMAQMERMGMAGTGVDEYYFQKAKQKGMALRFLESPMDQLRFLAGIGVGSEDQMISYILKDVGELPRLVGPMKSAWRRGDMQALYDTTMAPLKKDFPDLYRILMVDRNLNWLPRIRQMLSTPEVEFILVGAAHLAGYQGLLSLLREKGFSASAP